MLLESTFDCTVKSLDVFDELFKIGHEIDGYDLLLVQNESLNISRDISKLNFKKDRLLQLTTSPDKKTSENNDFFYIEEYQKNIKEMATILGLTYSEHDFSNQFIKIKVDYLLHIDEILTDLFIKISDDKYLKLIARNHTITSEELLRIQKKEIKHLYVKSSDYELFVESMDLMTDENIQEKRIEENISSLSITHEVLYQLNNSFGINDKALSFASKAMDLLYNIIDRDAGLKKIWENLANKRNFISDHSIMVAFLSNAILSHTAYSNENNSIKLSLSAVLHDLTLKDDKFIKLEINFSEIDDFSKRELDNFKAHITQAVDLLSKIEDIPADVDKIILCHHEKYDGTGGPRGIGWSKIPLLASIFIVAHEVVVATFQSKDLEFDLNNFINEKTSEYKEGYFFEAIEALKKIRL